jgi:molecular chaperone DnaK
MQKSYFGIDFGTTNAAVVQILVDEYGTKIINCREDDRPFSSLLAINKNDGTVLFGRQVKVKRQQLSRDYYIFSSFKSKLGKDEKIIIAGKQYTPTDITAMFLKSIKNYVKANMELEINNATFAIPVDFTPEQRRELKIAANAAGIEVNKFISESTAAYMRNIDLVKGLSKVAVFDWGGGTLDISILQIEKNILKELAIHGKKLGGDDIDKLLAKKIHSEIASKNSLDDFDYMSDKDKDDIIAKSEEAKIELSDYDFYRSRLIDYGMPGTVPISLELERFKEIIQPQIEDAVSVFYETIRKAGITPAQLDAIIMVGGSCEMQPIQEIMAQLFERKSIQIIYPENMQWSVAVGAAMVDSSNTKYKLSNSVGVILSDDTFYPIFKQNTAVPCEIDELRFGVVEETTDAHFIFVEKQDERKNRLDSVSVPVKGFTMEDIRLNAHINEDMIAQITLQSTYMGQKKLSIEINKLGFYYDLDDMEKVRENESSNKIKAFKSKEPKLCSYINCNEMASRGGYCDYHYNWEYANSK